MRHAALERWGLSVVVFLPLAAASASAQILPPGATPTKLTTGYVFTEGALYDPTGGVYFEDMHPSGQVATNPSHMVRYNIATGVASVVDPSSGGATVCITTQTAKSFRRIGSGGKFRCGRPAM